MKIVGFDLESDLISTDCAVPDSHVTASRAIAGVPVTGPDLPGSYPLDNPQVARIAEVAHIAINPHQCAYFPEAGDP